MTGRFFGSYIHHFAPVDVRESAVLWAGSVDTSMHIEWC